MKRALFVLLGFVFFLVIGFICGAGLSYIHAHHFAKSQDDMSSFTELLVLVFIPAFAIGGGVLGFFFHRSLMRR